MIVDAVISRQRSANGNRKYSSITIRRYLLYVAEDSGLLKSTFRRSKLDVAFIKFLVNILQNLGFNSGLTAQVGTVFLTFST